MIALSTWDAADRGCQMYMVHTLTEGYEAWGAVKCVLSYGRVGINMKYRLYWGLNCVTAF